MIGRKASVDCAHFIAFETPGGRSYERSTAIEHLLIDFVFRDPPGTTHHLLHPTCTSAKPRRTGYTLKKSENAGKDLGWERRITFLHARGFISTSAL